MASTRYAAPKLAAGIEQIAYDAAWNTNLNRRLFEISLEPVLIKASNKIKYHFVPSK